VGLASVAHRQVFLASIGFIDAGIDWFLSMLSEDVSGLCELCSRDPGKKSKKTFKRLKV
jgi:hypothetical protein